MNIHAITDFMTKYSFIYLSIYSAGEFTNEIFKSAIRTIQFYSECQAMN